MISFVDIRFLLSKTTFHLFCLRTGDPAVKMFLNIRIENFNSRVYYWRIFIRIEEYLKINQPQKLI